MNIKLPETIISPMHDIRPTLACGVPLKNAMAFLDAALSHYQKLLTYEFANATAEFYCNQSEAHKAATLTHAYRTLENFRFRARSLANQQADGESLIWLNHLFDGLLTGRVHLIPDFRVYEPLSQTIS